MKILWVENHTRFVQYAKHLLAGHDVTIVPSLAAARQALEDPNAAAAFDVVLVDFDLDDGKGEELMRQLQACPRRPWVVATSAHEDGNHALLAAGADAVCGKTDFSRILEVVNNLAGSGRRAD